MLLARLFYYLGCLSIAEISIRPFLDTTLSDWIFLVAIVLSIPVLLTSHKSIPYRIPHNIYLGTILFFLSAIFTLFWVDDPKIFSHSLLVIAKFSYMCLIWFWVATIIFTDARQIRFASICVASSSAISTLFEIYQRSVNPVFAWERASGLADAINQFGGTSAIGISLTFIYILGEKRKSKSDWARFFLLLTICALCATGLVLTKSLGSFVAIFSGFIFWLFLKRLKPRYIISITIIGTIAIGLLIYQQQTQEFSVLDRFQENSSLDSDSSTLHSRIGTYFSAIDNILKNPFVGVGIDVPTDTGYGVHNILLKIIYETGIVGGIGIGLIYISIFIAAIRRHRREKNSEYRLIGESLITAFFTFFIISLKEPIFYTRFGWISAALLLGLYSFPRKPRHQVQHAHNPITPMTSHRF